MIPYQWSKYFIVVASFLVALVLSVYPLPLSWRWWRPELVLLMTIYWVSVFPLTISLLFLCVVGLFQDLLFAVPLGQHSLAMMIVAYISIMSYRRVRNFALWKEAAWVFVLVIISQIPNAWVQTMAGRPVPGLLYIAPAITSALFWPLFRQGMERISSHYRIS
ncbi:MAG TPA: rod shape-determining protein MreD [Cellvibrio sp.]|nr:rod shape-determining protein MreD [Cellvibrio sp.]